MIYQHDRPKEATILEPKDFEFTIDCWLQDTTNLLDMNGYAEYEFSFQAKEMIGHQQIMEILEEAKRRVEMMKPRWSTKVPNLHHTNSKGEFICNQLFAPKVDVKVQHHSELHGRTATITCHPRDAVDGTIYLNASYVHIHPQPQPQKLMMELVNDGDYLEESDF